MHPLMIAHRTTAALGRALRATGVAVLLPLAACHQTGDWLGSGTDTPSQSALQLRLRPTTSDTVELVLTLGIGPLTSIGSLTADLPMPAGVAFSSCDAAQGNPLLACHAQEGTLRLAAAWTTGTHAGDLVRLRFVTRGAAAVQGSAWPLQLREVHAVAGHSVRDSLDVRAGAIK